MGQFVRIFGTIAALAAVMAFLRQILFWIDGGNWVWATVHETLALLPIDTSRFETSDFGRSYAELLNLRFVPLAAVLGGISLIFDLTRAAYRRGAA